MGSFSFKSVGKTREQAGAAVIPSSPIPVGILTPLSLGTDGSLFAVSYSLADQVHDNLRNLIQTNWGERLVLYKFGANLRPILSDMVSQDDFDAQAVTRIQDAVGKWMPFVSLEDFLSQTNRNNNGSVANVDITLTYSVPALGVSKRALQVSLRAM